MDAINTASAINSLIEDHEYPFRRGAGFAAGALSGFFVSRLGLMTGGVLRALRRFLLNTAAVV